MNKDFKKICYHCLTLNQPGVFEKMSKFESVFSLVTQVDIYFLFTLGIRHWRKILSNQEQAKIEILLHGVIGLKNLKEFETLLLVAFHCFWTC